MSLSCRPFSLLLFFSFLLISIPPPSSAQQNNNSSYSFSSSDSPWSPTQNRTLVSSNSVFAAGFQPQPNTSNLFTFQVWYHNTPTTATTAVWTANAHFPVTTSATLLVTSSGELRLSNSSSTGSNLWPNKPVGSSLILQDDGNLVFGNWSSFHYPTDTILPNQIMNGTTISSNNGIYAFLESTQLVFQGNDSYWSSGTFQMLDNAGKVTQASGASFISSDYGATRFRRLTLADDGNLRLLSLDPGSGQWTVVWQATQELCTVYGTCGPNYICRTDNSDKTTCICPPGFRQISVNGVETCERKIVIMNLKSSKFIPLDYVNYSGGSNQTNLNVQNLKSCQDRCLSDPKCQGFGFKYDGQGYCVLQLENLLYGYWSPGTETTFFLRVDGSETDNSTFTGMTDLLETTCPVRVSLPLPPKDSNTTTRNIVIICTLFAAELLSGVVFIWAFVKKYIKYRDMARTLGLELLPAGGPKRFSYAELKAATNDFSNIIGTGGFGDVYKGELSDHRIVAVKCLKNVTGGDAEFWAEVNIIARMHHLNLVRLWGFCAEKGKRILVYEHVPNGSLDYFLFQKGRIKTPSGSGEGENDDAGTEFGQKPMLDWNIRYRIALGVARAIAYLHEECLEWVLHCDIKPENILLGDDFCPKISDFGLAKLRKKEDMVSMSGVRGTRGYMAPEWVKMDPITPKADVYSFGMVLLEVVSGVRNSDIQGSKMDSEDWYFPRWAFDKVFQEMKVEDMLDPRIKHCYDSRAHYDMVDRMVKTAMWCLQDRPEMRPSMGKVAKMLEGTVEIMEPKKPTIFFLVDE